MSTAIGMFLDVNIENTNRGFALPGTTGSPGQLARGEQALTTLLPLIRQFGNLPKTLLKMTGQALKREAQRILTDSQEHFVPIDTGQLHDSAKVFPPTYSGKSIEVTFGYDGVANERGSMYTIPVHEIPAPPGASIGGRSASHPRGEWRYLLTPFLNAMDGLVGRVVSDVKGNLEGRADFIGPSEVQGPQAPDPE